MSSSQTMTAPAVGHRPSEPGPSMSSLYDYSRSQHSSESDHSPSHSPPNDSAIRNLHDSVPDNSSSPNGLPSISGMVAVKSESEDQSSHAISTVQASQTDFRRQSAASALLAQLLGGQQAPISDANQSMECLRGVTAQDNEQKQQPADRSNEQWETQQGESVPPSEAETKGNQSQPTPTKTADPIEGLTDPLLFSKPNLDHPHLFPPLESTAAPEPSLEAFQQNGMLNAAYLPQGADLSALGYTEGILHHDGNGSVAGSEPRIQAFAKLEFDDGHFYCNTYSFILGRDVRAARAAHQREFQVRQAMRTSQAKSSSGGNASHTPIRVKPEGSGMIGSVVSDRGGIMGFDPDVPPHMQSRIDRRSSNSSHGETGGLLHATPAQLQSKTDYNALALQSLQEHGGDAKPVDALALLPSPDSCPTIPIHPPATTDGSVAGHRGISRKHVKIAYNFEKNFFEMEVLGRNGAFIGADWLSPGQIRPLHSGDYIQIGGVRIRFLLPDVPIGETGADIEEEPFAQEAEGNSQGAATAENEQEDAEKSRDGSKPTKIVLKAKEADHAQPAQSIEGDGQQPPVRRRGPGRPPKDGIMSKRERAELAREQKLAARREANGGVTPPPQQNKSKAGKTTMTPGGTMVPNQIAEGESPGSKPEKRKYTKRKKPDGTSMDIPLPSTEGGQIPLEHQPQEYVKPPPVKKRKPSRSPSPNYPPESAYTPEDLAKPPYNYAVLIFDALTEATAPMTLKQIYRALKLKYPYFRFKCETEGWTSSVRHNLNGNGHLFMHAERDGKGWSWQLRPGASVEKEKKRRPSPPPPPSSQPLQASPSVPPQYIPPPTHSYENQPTGQSGMTNTHFQLSSMPSSSYPPATTTPAPAPPPPSRHPTPYPPPAQLSASSPFPIPSPIRNNLPPAFAQTTPTTYTSPYASDPPPQLLQYQQSQQAQAQQQQHMQPPPPLPPPHHQPSYHPPNTQSHPPSSHQSQSYPPNSGIPAQHHQQQPQQQHPQYNMGAQDHHPLAADALSDDASFNERASKAIDDFEAVLLEDYEDKEYIKNVLKSARARALGNATETSFPGGEPPDEAVILDALRNLIKGLRGE
ncbi:forkhead domain protein [Aspergillus lucknowensis]|uniref:Forkhead domain protein n=1 Tax=Aspergillus lucknowensis TaxID=176173 RepID=A0ABR4LV11_9EURO